MSIISRAFLIGYRKENGNAVIAKARNPRYLSPFLPVLAPNMIAITRQSSRRIFLINARKSESPRR
jgi:hypothetical protein